MTQPDDLIDNYRAAQKLQNNAGPSELTRNRILAHAEQLANNKPSEDAAIPPENTIDLIAKETINTPAANDSQWKIRVFASVAVFGIAGLLMLQVSREAPDEFLPKAKPPVSAESSAEPAADTVAQSESKSTADKTVPATAQAPAALAAPAPSITTPAASLPPSAVPSATPAQAPAPKSAPLPEQRAKKNDSASRDDLEVSTAKAPKQQNEPRAETRADKATEVAPAFAPPPPPSAVSVATPPASPAPAVSTPAPALTTMVDSAKLSRSAPIATRSTTHAITNANAKLFRAIQTKDAAAMKQALDGDDDKNAKNAAGTPALSLCVQSEQLSLLRLLIAAGADVNALDAQGVSPLTHARNRGLTEIVNLLLNADAK